MSKIKVRIPEEKYIPTLGKGPFRKPTVITQEQYRMLKRMGYVVNIVEKDDTETVFEKAEIERNVPNKEAVEVIQEPMEEDEPQQIEIVESEETVQEEEEETVKEDEAEVEEDLSEEDQFGLTKEDRDFLENDAKRAEIIEKFKEKDIDYNGNDTIPELLARVELER